MGSETILSSHDMVWTPCPPQDVVRAASFALIAFNVIDVILGIPILHMLLLGFAGTVARVCYDAGLFRRRQSMVCATLIAITSLLLCLICSPSMLIFIADLAIISHVLYRVDLKRIPKTVLLASIVFDYFTTQWLRYFPSPIWRVLLSISASVSSLSMLCFILAKDYDLGPYLKKYKDLMRPAKIAKPALDYAKTAPAHLNQKASGFTDKLMSQKSMELWVPAKARLETGAVFTKHTKGSISSRFVKLNAISGCIEWWMPDSSALVGQTPVQSLVNTIRDGKQLSVRFITRTLVLEAATVEVAIQWSGDLDLLLQYKNMSIIG